MIIINKPEELIEVQCYKCKSIIKTHPAANLNSLFFTNCGLHKQEVLDGYSAAICDCKHESDGMIYTSHPPQNKCKICGMFYR